MYTIKNNVIITALLPHQQYSIAPQVPALIFGLQTELVAISAISPASL
jgi:hypothetical protein